MTNLKRLLVIAAVLMVGTGAAFAQLQTGNLYGNSVDNEGNVLPGVTVTLTGGGAPQVQVTNAQGQFRFLGLAPGTYSLSASLDGFSTVDYPNIAINVGRNTTIEVELSAAIEETITVTSESPLLDSRKISTGATVSQVELEKIPSARDPWSVLQTVPGVQTDRINVGGNESGQQSQYVGPGSDGDDAVWAVDGVVITDMAAIGSSPTYYNFDAFEEMQATTGGSDASLATGGVTLNMVTRRGTNEWRGSGRFIKADDSWQSGLSFSEGDLGEGQSSFSQGNRIVSVEDWGAEVGGPILRDKLWIWANYGRNEIDLLTIDDVSDFTKLEDYGGKLNAQLTSKNSGVFFYNYGDKIKIGRNAGPTRPQPTTWNQTGPTDIWKIEDTHVFSSNFYLTGMASYVGGGFQLTPQGGLDGPAIVLDADFVWQNNFFHHDTDRPQDQWRLDGNVFFNTGNVSHDLKFGVGYRTADLLSQSLWPGNGVRYDFYTAFGYDYNIFAAARTTGTDLTTEYTSLYAQDTMTVGDLTLNVGLRMDTQDATVNPVNLPGVPGFEALPDGTPLLPATTVPGFEQPFDWQDIVPRLGLTYALGPERKTLLRASYARFAEQLRNGYATQTYTGGYAYAYFYYDDANGDGFVTPSEIIDFADGPLFDNGYDPFALTTNYQADPNFSAPITDELILSVEHALRPEFVIGAVLTLRNKHNIAEFERLVNDNGVIRPHTRADYVPLTGLPSACLNDDTPGVCPIELPDGSVYNIRMWGFGDVGDEAGSYLTNGDREQDYEGLSLTFNKRLANRWMMRGNFTLSDWTWSVPESEREDPNIYLGGGYVDGGAVLQGSGTGSGSKGSVYINAGWSYSITGMYQVAPEKSWGFNLSAALNGREGYAIPYYLGRIRVFEAATSNFQATDEVDDYRLDDINMVDLRVEKEFSFKDSRFTVGVELFNAFNQSTVLQRQHRLGRSTSDHVIEILSPRIFRIGVRFAFN